MTVNSWRYYGPQPRIPPKSPLGQAVFYTLNQWVKLNNYLLDGRLENNNDAI